MSDMRRLDGDSCLDGGRSSIEETTLSRTARRRTERRCFKKPDTIFQFVGSKIDCAI
jgi:hypothetical protein